MTTNKPEAVAVNEDKMRAEFEAWAGSKKFGLSKGHFKRDENGEYLNFPTQCYWDVWQASRAALVVEQKPADRPEVAAWYTPPAKDTLPVVALNDRSKRGEPLIRLSDYEALQVDRAQQYDMKVKAREQRDAVTAKLKALQAECEQLRKDAERYRWITSHGEWTEYVEYAICEDGRKPVIDSAIDVAMREENK